MPETEDWQSEAGNVKERISSLYTMLEFTDVEILVGTEDTKLFKTSKVILASGSAVFASMLFGSATVKMSPILLPDIEPVVFERMLEFIYFDEMSEIEEKVTLSIYLAAERYMMPLLQKICLVTLFPNEINFPVVTMELNSEVTCFLFEKAIFYDIEPLKDLCKRYFRENTNAILNSQWFFEAQEISVETILQQPTVSVSSEFELLKALVNWIKYSPERMIRLFHLMRYICFANLQTNDLNTLFRDNPGFFIDEEMVSVLGFLNDRSLRRVPEWCNIWDTREYKRKMT